MPFLEIMSSQDPPIKSKEHYATFKQLHFAYKAASSEAEKSASRPKEQYDSKVCESTVDIGDHVLIRKVGLKGKNKFEDKCGQPS